MGQALCSCIHVCCHEQKQNKSNVILTYIPFYSWNNKPFQLCSSATNITRQAVACFHINSDSWLQTLTFQTEDNDDQQQDQADYSQEQTDGAVQTCVSLGRFLCEERISRMSLKDQMSAAETTMRAIKKERGKKYFVIPFPPSSLTDNLDPGDKFSLASSFLSSP